MVDVCVCQTSWINKKNMPVHVRHNLEREASLDL